MIGPRATNRRVTKLVYIKELQNPAVAGLPGGFRIPGLVGTGLTTLPVANTVVTKGATDSTDTIPTESYTLVRVTAVGDVPDLEQYVENTDWRQVGSTIVWINGGQQPTTGADYYVSWTRSKLTAEYLPTMYTTMDEVRTNYGNELDEGILNCIPLAAKQMFDNGAPAVVIAQATTGSQSDLQTAIDNMKTEDIDVLIVPQATNTTLTNYVRAHVLTQSAPAVQKERWYITSADALSDASTTIVNKGITVSDERMWLVAPPSFVITLKDATYKEDADNLVSSTYMAAQVAGTVTNPNFDAAAPLTRRSVVGAKNLSTHNYTEATKDYLGTNGIMVLEEATGGVRIRHGLTTDTTNVNTVTAQVLVIKDHIRKTLRSLLDKQYIGTKITASTPSSVASTIDSYLKQKVTDEIIVNYQSINVSQDSGDPRTINVSFDILPAYELDFIDVSFSLATV